VRSPFGSVMLDAWEPNLDCWRHSNVRALRRYLIAAIACAIVTAGCSSGHPAPAAVAKAAAVLASEDQDMKPTSATYYQVSSRRAAVLVLSQGDDVQSNNPGYAIVLRGNFTDERAGGTSGKPRKGHFVYAFVDKANGEIQDDGVSNAQPDLSKLGRAMPFSCCG